MKLTPEKLTAENTELRQACTNFFRELFTNHGVISIHSLYFCPVTNGVWVHRPGSSSRFPFRARKTRTDTDRHTVANATERQISLTSKIKINKKAVLLQRLPRDARDRTIRQYAHGLLLESPFVPSSTDCWAIRARQKRPYQWP